MITYISGPITGHDDYLEQFKEAESKLRLEGHTVVNPAWIMEPFAKTDARHEDFMEACLRLMGHSESIYMLNGWETSKGAMMEYKEAQKLGLWIRMEKEVNIGGKSIC